MMMMMTLTMTIYRMTTTIMTMVMTDDDDNDNDDYDDGDNDIYKIDNGDNDFYDDDVYNEDGDDDGSACKDRRPQLFFHLRHFKSNTLGLVSAFVTTRLDYCNSVLAGLPQASIDLLQRVQNVAARLVAGIETRDHITPVLRSLHWLPIRLRIQYKLCVLMHQVLYCIVLWTLY